MFLGNKYETLKQIGLERRADIANYMYSKNLKLYKGDQEFIRNEPTFIELINDSFKFEKIEETEQNVVNMYRGTQFEIKINTDDIDASYVKNIISGNITYTANLRSNDVVIYIHN